jgi:hypothetical protein
VIEKIFHKEQQHFINSTQKLFWDNGFIHLNVPQNQKKNTIFNILKSVNSNINNYKHVIKEKYKSKGIIDLREEDEFYDPFIDFLIEDDLIKKLNFICCKQFVPIAIKIRINGNQKKEKNLFFNRHRDTYRSNKILYGNIPPLINLNIYPQFFTDKPEKQLKLWPGSHKKFYSNNIDKINIFLNKGKDINTSNDHMLIFDTSLVHAIYPTANPQGSIRCMYNFLDTHQIHENLEDYHLIQKWKKKIYGS